jgi:outer membrane protein TolC
MRWLVLAILIVSSVFLQPAELYAQKAAGEGPLSLKECLKKVLESHPLLAEARLGITAAQKSVDSAAAKHLPRLSLDANYLRRQDPYPFIPAQAITIIPHFSDSYASWGVALTLPLYEGGQAVEAVNLSRVRKTMQEWNLALTRNELIGNLVNTYNKILQLTKIRELSAASVMAMERLQASSRLPLHSNRSALSAVDLLKIEVQVANERQRLFSLGEGIVNLSAALRVMMGDTADGALEVALLSDELSLPDLAGDSDMTMEIVAAAGGKRADKAIASLAVQEAGIQGRIAGGRLFPAIKGYAGYIDQFGFNPWYKEANWYAGITFSLPLFEKSLYDDQEKERILQKKAEKRVQVLENQMRLDIGNALSLLRECRARILTTRKTVELAEESLRIEEEKVMDVTTPPAIEFFMAQTARVTAAANHFQAIFDSHAAIVAHRKATGRLEEYLH